MSPQQPECAGENASRPSVTLDPNPKTFVEQKPTIHPPEGGRNAPCSCNSGKKFKKCCGKSPSYEVDSNGNHRLATTKTEEVKPKVKELNFQNLAGLDDATVAAHFPQASEGSQAESPDTPVGNDNGEGVAQADGSDVHSVPAGI